MRNEDRSAIRNPKSEIPWGSSGFLRGFGLRHMLLAGQGVAWRDQRPAPVPLNDNPVLPNLDHLPRADQITDSDGLFSHNGERFGGVPEYTDEYLAH